MKRCNRRSTLVFILLLLALPVKIDAETIRLANGEWAPYLSQHLKYHGAASHIISAAFSKVGVTVEYGFFPWKRAYKLAQKGEWHGTPVWVYTATRAKDFIYSAVVIEDSEYLFHLKSLDLRWTNVEDLRGLNIGATLHTVYPLFEKAEAQGILKLERAGNYANLYRRLIKGRIDAIPNVRQVGLYFLRATLSREERRRITYSPTIIQERRYHLILSKKHPASKRLLELFNDGLDQIRKNGMYDQILKQLEDGFYDHEESKPSRP